ncbi:MAG: ORF6N domain-containing protein, partial [Candidatus Magasanikbacteria bacterium]|nr:ORF6N domain-containing protein [Candidatus Magasanikbacteria bacterium]
MDKLETINKQNLQDKIHTIRGFQVMLDRDLAELYGVKPIRLREQVKRNIERFPNDFMFQLSENEVDFMVSQNAIPSKQHLGGSLPLVFTEQGVATLSSVLTSKMAVEIHIQIMRAFVNMRKFISNNALIFQRLDSLEQKQFRTEEKIDVVLSALENKTKKPDEGIFFDGQIYDAYAFINDLLKSAKSEVVLIDNYID